MKVTVFHLDDYEELKRLFFDVFTSEPWCDQWQNDAQLDNYLNELVSNNNSLTLILLDDENNIIGGSLGYVFSWWQGKEYFIKEFFISNKMQNQGLGSFFLKQINEYLLKHDIKHILLSTDTNTPAYNFYKKNGFDTLKNNVTLLRSTD